MKQRETSMYGCLLYTPYWGPGRNPGMCLDWESNPLLLGSQANTQSTEPQQPGKHPKIFKKQIHEFKNYKL